MRRPSTRTMGVLCPDWPLVAAGLSEVPSACVHAGRVLVCSAAARREGVRAGQRRREAEGLCGDLAVIPRDEARDARVFEKVVAAVAAFTPRVEVLVPGVCAFPTRGPARYFGGEQALASLIRQAVAPVSCRIGIADGPFAAVRAAERGVIVEHGRTAEFLAPLPVSVLGMPEMADLLNRLGIRTLGDLGGLGEGAVTERFGSDGARAWHLSQGMDDRALVLSDPPPDLSVRRELEGLADRVDTAAFFAAGLAEELCSRLSALELACTRLRVEAETEHGETLSRLWRADRPFTARTMVDRVRWQLEGWLTASVSGSVASQHDVQEPTGAIAVLGLVADEVIRYTGRQIGFWGEASEADLRAERGLVRIQGLLGHEAVVTAVASGGRSFAEQYRLVPWGDPRGAVDGSDTPAGGSRRRVKPKPAPPGPPWPGRLIGPAPAVVLDSSAPAVEVALRDAEGELVRVSGRGQLSAEPAVCGSREVSGWAGPWPIDERWWDSGAHRRRARMQVMLADGSARLLALEDGHWYVEASYD